MAEELNGYNQAPTTPKEVFDDVRVLTSRRMGELPPDVAAKALDISFAVIDEEAPFSSVVVHNPAEVGQTEEKELGITFTGVGGSASYQVSPEGEMKIKGWALPPRGQSLFGVHDIGTIGQNFVENFAVYGPKLHRSGAIVSIRLPAPSELASEAEPTLTPPTEPAT